MVTTNKHILNWVDEMAALCTPDKIVWIDGSEEQAEALRAEACSTGEMIKLNPEKLPGCYLHRTAVNDVARVEGRTRQHQQLDGSQGMLRKAHKALSRLHEGQNNVRYPLLHGYRRLRLR